MKVLITGGAGFIGTRLSRNLLSGGHSVTVLDNFNPQIHGANTKVAQDLRDRVQTIRGDVRDLPTWERALPGHDAVVNLAAETGTGQSMYEVTRYEQVNLAGTANLYDVLARNKDHTIKRVVVASSRAVYGEGAYKCERDGIVYPLSRSQEDKRKGYFDPLCPSCGQSCATLATPESSPFQPSSFYGLTKQVQEQMTLLFGQVLGIPSFALRYQNVYGPGQSLQNPYTGILAIFSNLARMGADINVFEDGKESRDFVYIDDVVDATAVCVESDLRGIHVLNIGSRERITVLQVANAVNEYFGGKSRVKVNGAFRDGDIRHGLADISTAEKLIAYKPEWRFERGLKEFLDWTLESEPSTELYESSLIEMKDRGLLHGR